jgi:hypothetical protein
MLCQALPMVCRWATVMPLARNAPAGDRPGDAKRLRTTNVAAAGVACTRLRPCVADGGPQSLNLGRAVDRNGSAVGGRPYGGSDEKRGPADC